MPFGDPQGRFDTGFDYSNDGYSPLLANSNQFLDGVCGRGIARDHQRLHSPANQVAGQALSVALHRSRRAGAIRNPGSVAEVDQIFRWKCVPQGPHHGETTYAGIKNANGEIGATQCCSMNIG
jgi:hypothetical protein